MTTQPAKADAIEAALVTGDLLKLSTEDRLAYLTRFCESVGLNPLTRPLEYITLNGRLTLYARKDCTDQLRSRRGVSVQITGRETSSDLCIVTARATLADGRHDEAIGAVPIANLKGEALANAMMKAETKAKRRVTLSICGLGLLDESEIDGAQAGNRVVDESAASVAALPAASKTPEAPPPESDDDAYHRFAALLKGALSEAMASPIGKAIQERWPDVANKHRRELAAVYARRKGEKWTVVAAPQSGQDHDPDTGEVVPQPAESEREVGEEG